jgi:hypothetical protein
VRWALEGGREGGSPLPFLVEVWYGTDRLGRDTTDHMAPAILPYAVLLQKK